MSGHPDKAKRVAAAYDVNPKSLFTYESYDRLADNPDVEAVFVILPNSMHAEYTVRALKAGKHVLCEKPMAATVPECEQLIAAAKATKRKLMIAYRLRYEPFHTTAIEMCRKGALGKIKTIAASNNQTTKAPNIRLSRELAGGPLQDIGNYCLNAARYLTGEEPAEVTATAHQPKDDPQFREVPESELFTLRFPSGVVANCDCSFGSTESRHLRVQGAGAVLEIDRAFAYRGQAMRVGADGTFNDVGLTPANHFAAEIDHLAECVMADRAPLTPGEEGLADIRVIAAVEQSIRTGQSVSLRG